MKKFTFRPNRSVAFGVGILGALAMTVVSALARGLGIMDFNLEMTLGSLFTGSPMPGSQFLGFLLHLFVGGILGLIYLKGFSSMRRANTGLGVLFGFANWVAAGIFFGILPAFHPLLPNLYQPPGFFVVNLGPLNFLAILGLHLMFGAIVGYGCGRLGASVVHPRLREIQAGEWKRTG